MRTSDLLLIGTMAVGGYYIINRNNDQDNVMEIVGSGASGYDTSSVSGGVVEGVLSKKQLDTIKALDTTNEPTTLTTQSIGNYGRSVITTSSANIPTIEKKAFNDFYGTDTIILYKKGGKIEGGSDFGLNASLTPETAKFNYENRKNPMVTALRSASRSSRHRSSSKKKKKSAITRASDKKTKPIIKLSKRKDKVIRDYENKHRVTTSLKKKEIKKLNYASKIFHI